ELAPAELAEPDHEDRGRLAVRSRLGVEARPRRALALPGHLGFRPLPREPETRLGQLGEGPADPGDGEPAHQVLPGDPDLLRLLEEAQAIARVEVIGLAGRALQERPTEDGGRSPGARGGVAHLVE